MTPASTRIWAQPSRGTLVIAPSPLGTSSNFRPVEGERNPLNLPKMSGQTMPMAANMQTRPCLSSTARRRSKSSLVPPSQKPIGSQKSSGSQAPISFEASKAARPTAMTRPALAGDAATVLRAKAAAASTTLPPAPNRRQAAAELGAAGPSRPRARNSAPCSCSAAGARSPAPPEAGGATKAAPPRRQRTMAQAPRASMADLAIEGRVSESRPADTQNRC
mmetsp:Transcript_4180/g.9439  ORF Transcript_4180/g.9439 Transcript_4180/m.9439 type:complete len:220 (+) Transcript_4180:1898-2557(+)